MWNHIKIVRLIKSIIPLEIKLILCRILVIIQGLFYKIWTKRDVAISKTKRNIFILLSTDYSNLGDHAMTYAHIKLLKREFPESEIIEVLVGDTLKNLWYIAENIKEEDIITLKGGGNIGIEYFREELIRRKILKTFPNNKVILFPQTVFFPKSKIGEKEFKNTVEVFNKHKQFYAFFRDKFSYECMKKEIDKNIFLTPDIVFSLGKIKFNEKREGVVTCLRSDVEGVYSEKQRKELIDMLKQKFTKVNVTDTIKEYYISTEEREKELNKIWNEFGKAELIVTDRLHGMIFAALIGTPCIVFKTYNHKLTGQYEWLKDVKYIENIELDNEKVEECIDRILDKDIELIEMDKFDKYFEKLVESIRE